MAMTTDWVRGVWERRGFRNRLLWVGLLPASVVYRLIIHVRNLLFAWGWLKTKRLSRPVVSVGNLTVGGTGKTPTCIWLAQELTKRGLRIGILSRGYKRKNTESMVVSPQPLESLSSNSNDEILKAGDEPFMMAQLYGHGWSGSERSGDTIVAQSERGSVHSGRRVPTSTDPAGFRFVVARQRCDGLAAARGAVS
jgi:tetraacyldisaccharide 4'-kinase